jgi:hypothetical protein
MMETIACRITIWPAGLLRAFGHHLSAGVFVIRLFFFFSFAIDTNGLMVDDRQDPAFCVFYRIAAATARFNT